MKAIILLVLACSAFAVRLSSKQAINKVVEDLQKSKQGSTLLHMVQLHAMVQGPIDELVEALEELVSDINNSLEEIEHNFHVRTSEYNSNVIRLNQQIQDADIDINRTEDLLDNLLKPRQAQLENKITQVQENQEQNRQNLAENTLVREQEHESYEAQVEELNSATESVDEALALIATLGNPSLLQVKKFKTSLALIEKKINKRGRLSPMIKALITLASNQNFSNQDIVKSIVDALNEFRNEVVSSLNSLTNSEAEAVVEFEERCDQLDAEHSAFGRQIVDITVHLTATVEKIEETQQFQNTRVADLKAYTALLELENDQYAEETQIFTDSKNEHLRELAVCEQTVTVVKSADLSGIKAF